MNTEMYSEELHPPVHTAAVAVWAISTCNYTVFHAVGTYREQGLLVRPEIFKIGKETK